MSTLFANMTVEQLQSRIESGRLSLVDVRSEGEIAGGRIPGSLSLPLHLLPLKLAELDRNTTTIFYCQMGGRSAQAAAWASAHGFTEVFNLQGGIAAWARAGLPISS